MRMHTLNSIGAGLALALFLAHLGPWLLRALCP